jgi:hypothetical protein
MDGAASKRKGGVGNDLNGHGRQLWRQEKIDRHDRHAG